MAQIRESFQIDAAGRLRRIGGDTQVVFCLGFVATWRVYGVEFPESGNVAGSPIVDQELIGGELGERHADVVDQAVPAAASSAVAVADGQLQIVVKVADDFV